MAPIRKGDGTPLEIPGVSEVRSGDGRVFFEGDAIPDSGGDHQWDYDDGEGTEVGDSIGSLTLNYTGISWVVNGGVGDAYAELDGVDDYASVDNDNFTHFISGPEGTVFLSARIDSPNDRRQLFGTERSGDNNNLSIEHTDGGYQSSLTIGGTSVAVDGGSVPAGEWVVLAWVVDSNNVTLYEAAPPDYDLTQINSGTTPPAGSGNWEFDVQFGREVDDRRYHDGGFDYSFVDSNARNVSDLQTIVDDIKDDLGD